VRPFINKRRCPAQDKVCKAVPACPQGAMKYVSDETERLGGKIVFNYEKCDGCGICVTECCGSAIDMQQVVAT
jgi:Pyruvate/2-oxoacid:ferredoxin oxidoreductase delta subunit